MRQRTGDDGWLAEVFEEHRPRLRAVAYRMLGSVPDADDAVQDAWVRFSQSRADGVENLGGFLTTIVARVCLNVLHGAAAVARRAAAFIRRLQAHPSLVNGAAGVVLTDEGRPVAVMGFTIVAGKIVEIDAITEPERLSGLDLPFPRA